MPKSSFALTNLTAGELSPLLKGRFDISRYSNAAKTIENFIIHQAGGCMFRPASRYVAEAKTSSDGKVRLYPFQFSTTQSYILEFGDNYVRFYANNGQVVSGTPVETVTPYAIADIFDLQFAQDADTLYISHNSYPTYKLQRTSATTFTMTAVGFSRGPFLDVNITATTMTPSAATGAGITLTASVASFTADNIGSFYRIKDGVVLITAYTSTTVVTGTVQDEPDGTAGNLGGTAATDDWAEGSWSARRGYPNSVAFHEQRLVFANTPHEPQKFWASVVQEYENFNVDDASADDSYAYKIATEQVNAIRWLSSGPKSMQIGTSGATFSASSGNTNEPITPSSIVVQRDTTYGAADVLPKRIGNYLYYVQRNTYSLRELGYSFDIDAQQSLDMTLLSDHILRDGDGAIEMAYQQSPHNRVWIVRDDGEMAVMTRNREQEVTGWSRVVAGDDTRGQGKYESVAIIPGDGGDDQIWVSVRRYIDGAYVRYIEYFEAEDFDQSWDIFYVDSGLSLDSPKTITGATKASPVVVTATAHGFADGDQIRIDEVVGMTELNGEFFKVANKTDDTFELTTLAGVDVNGDDYTAYVSSGEAREMVTAISGLGHLEGETVSVIADGAVTDDATVASGAITLGEKAGVVHVGLPYTGTIRLLPSSDGSATGTGQTKNRRSYIATFRLYRSLGGKVGIDYDYLDELDNEIQSMYRIYLRAPNDVMNQPTPLITADVQKQIDTDWDKETELIVQQDQALPLNILAIVVRSDLQEK